MTSRTLDQGLQGLAVIQVLLPGAGAETHGKLVVSLVAVLAVIVLRNALLSVVRRRVSDPAVRYHWAKTSSYVAFVVAALVVTQVWFTALRSVGTFLGLLSAGIAIALKDVIANLAGWAFLLWRRPFDVGDRIQIGAHAGDVVDIRLFAFSLMEIGNWVEADQSTGRVIHVPNATVFTQPQANYTSGFAFIWNELEVTLTFGSDWKRAKGLLEQIAERTAAGVAEAAQRSLEESKGGFLIHYQKLTSAVYTSVVDSGVRLTLRYLTRPRERRGTAQALWEEVLTVFSGEPGLVFAHPTQRVVLQRAPEGPSPGHRARGRARSVAVPLPAKDSYHPGSWRAPTEAGGELAEAGPSQPVQEREGVVVEGHGDRLPPLHAVQELDEPRASVAGGNRGGVQHGRSLGVGVHGCSCRCWVVLRSLTHGAASRGACP